MTDGAGLVRQSFSFCCRNGEIVRQFGRMIDGMTEERPVSPSVAVRSLVNLQSVVAPSPVCL